MKVRRDESSPLVIKLLREGGWTAGSDLNQPVFFVYGNDKLLISAEGYLSRSSPWLRERDSITAAQAQASLSPAASLIFLSGGAEMKGCYLALGRRARAACFKAASLTMCGA